MTSSEDDWLARVSEECRKAIICFGTFNADKVATALGNLRKLLDEKVEVTDFTWQTKNLMASIAVSEVDLFSGRELLRNSAIQRLTETRRYIADVRPARPAVNPFVQGTAAK